MVGRLKLGDTHEVVAGVIAGTGEVQSYINGNSSSLFGGKFNLPPVTPDVAGQWADLLRKAADAADVIRLAHEQYQAAIVGAVAEVNQ